MPKEVMRDTVTISKIGAVFLICLIGLVPMLWTENTISPNLSIQVFSLSVILFFIYIRSFFIKEIFFIKNKVTFYFLLIFFIYIIYSSFSVYISINPTDGLFVLTKYCLFFIFTISIIELNDPKNILSFVSKIVVTFSFLSSVPAFLELFDQIGNSELIIPKSTYYIHSIFAHRNLFVEHFILAFPFSIFLIFTSFNHWKYLSIFQFSSTIFFVVILSNRTSWVCLTSTILIVLFFLVWKRGAMLAIKKTLLFLLLTLSISSISIGVLFSYSDSSSLKTHAFNSLDLKQGSTKDRFQLWKRTSDLISESPIIGSGLESWKVYMLKYGNTGLVSTDNRTFYQRPHNDFLWVFAEQGIVGLLLYLSLFLIIFFMIAKSFLSKEGVSKQLETMIILAVVINYLLISLLNFPRERVGHNVILFTSVGVLLGYQIPNFNFKLFKYHKYVLTGLLGLIIVVTYSRFRSEIFAKEAILLKSSSNFEACINKLEMGRSVFYKMDPTSAPLSWFEGLSYFKLNQYQKAEKSFKESLELNPYHIYTLSDYASCLVKLKKEDLAIKYYRKAIKVSPSFLDPKLNLCALYFKSKDYSSAFELLKTTDPEINLSRYKKTVQLILQKIINKEIKNKHHTVKFETTYYDNFKNYAFFKSLLKKAIESNLTTEELVKII